MRQIETNQILTTMLKAYDDVSDLNITAGKQFQVESDGQLMPVFTNPPINQLTPFQTEVFALNLIGGDRRLTKELLIKGSCDSSYEVPGEARFRVNIFSQRGCYSTVMRQLPTKIPTIASLKLPEAFSKMSQEKNGIILVTGATGSGKSTSLAAVLNEMNENESFHIVTLEDPIEFTHPQKKCTFNQRELGVDYDSFSSGLRAALRQAPKVILVGEMRDRETVEIGLSAAETGHLVFSTLHTVNAGQAINRILGMFDQEEEKQIRIRLADTMRWIVCQRLLPKVGGGRVAAFDILGSNIRSQDTILNGESEGKTFYEIMEASLAFGMMTFEHCIIEHYKKGLITEETAIGYASRRSVIKQSIDSLKSAKGEKTTDIEELSLDDEYGKQKQKSIFIKR